MNTLADKGWRIPSQVHDVDAGVLSYDYLQVFPTNIIAIATLVRVFHCATAGGRYKWPASSCFKNKIGAARWCMAFIYFVILPLLFFSFIVNSQRYITQNTTTCNNACIQMQYYTICVYNVYIYVQYISAANNTIDQSVYYIIIL